jgi:thermitase
MSFGGPYVSDTVLEAVNEALAAGLVLVSSAGNEYSYNEPSYPAAFNGVIAVAATDRYDNLASFSNFGDWVEIAAPGVNILSAYPGAGCGGIADCYNWLEGTSMASPIVAGAAALVFDSIGGNPIVRSETLRDNVINAILNNADHTGALGQNMLAWTQHGRLNIQAALTGGGGNIPPDVQITSPTAGSPFNEGDNIIIEANADDSDGNVTQVEFFQEAVFLGMDDTGSPYSVTWNNVPAGSYSLTAVATDNSNATTTSDAVLITVSPTSSGCTAEPWDPDVTYSKHDIVSHNNHEWKAKNTNTDVEPGTSKRYWTDLGLCN